jgi:hypothetical protein
LIKGRNPAVDRGAVAALAGRRIDAPNAKEPRFPLENVPGVRLAISELLEKERVAFLICSAACGADLLALDVAIEAGVDCRVILPFDMEHFRQTSVIDRPGDWQKLFDPIVAALERNGGLVVLDGDPNVDSSYRRANEVIIEEALAASDTPPRAILVWEGRPRDEGDVTAQFQKLAAAAGMPERTIPTLCTSSSRNLPN